MNTNIQEKKESAERIIGRVEKLRREGHKVRVGHYRYILNTDGTITFDRQGRILNQIERIGRLNRKDFLNQIVTRGGKTVVEVTFKDEDKLYVATAKCNPEDAYSKKFGVDFCINRIMAERDSEKLALIKRAEFVLSNPEEAKVREAKRLAAQNKAVE